MSKRQGRNPSEPDRRREQSSRAPGSGRARSSRSKGGGRPQGRPSRTRPAAAQEGGDAAAQLGERLQKVLAQAGVASRRDCEEMILAGRVTVNGQRVHQLPVFVDAAADRIEVDGVPIARPRRKASPREHVCVALHKPRNVVSTTSDPEGRRTVTDLVDLPPNLPRRLFPVGRLDADSTGLILLTNDGELANRLTHPRYQVAKKYQVSVRGRLTAEQIQKLKSGLFLTRRKGEQVETKRAAMESVQVLGTEQDRTRGDRTQLMITLREGQNREIRRMLARLGFKVRRLKRVAIGPVSLQGIAPGHWRLLTSTEVRKLYAAAEVDQG